MYTQDLYNDYFVSQIIKFFKNRNVCIYLGLSISHVFDPVACFVLLIRDVMDFPPSISRSFDIAVSPELHSRTAAHSKPGEREKEKYLLHCNFC